MNLFRVLLQKLLPAPPKTSDDPISMVLLQREPRSIPEQALRDAAQRAWSRSFTGDSPMHCVVQKGPVTLMKVGPWLLNFPYAAQPYFDGDLDEQAKLLPRKEQRKPWAEHRGWFAVD